MAEYMETEYIKKPVFKIAVKSYFKHLTNKGKHLIDVNDAKADVIRIISELPAADVAEVIHAENITDLNPVDAFVCSNCGFACDDVSETINDEYGNFSHYREFEFKFCPNCGAKMDGVE